MRVEGLSSVEARSLAVTARRAGGRALRLARSRPAECVIVLQPVESRDSFFRSLRADARLLTLARELESARRASRGEVRHIRLARREIALARRTLVQGILNVTPDSFHDGGRYSDPHRARERAWRMKEEGADLIDVGGESSRPGSSPVPAREEIKRVVPVIEALAGKLGIPISVDTTKSEVAEAALAAGAEMVNDISGLTFDPALVEVVARHRAGLILSHIRGRPRNMQRNPRYRYLLPEVIGFLQGSLRKALEAGVHQDAILVDPGIGFGKTVTHNLLLLRYLPALHSTGRPILLGASRKSFLGKLQRHAGTGCLHGSLAVAALGVLSGVSVLRVHDVAETVEVIRVAKAVRDATMERPRE